MQPEEFFRSAGTRCGQKLNCRLRSDRPCRLVRDKNNNPRSAHPGLNRASVEFLGALFERPSNHWSACSYHWNPSIEKELSLNYTSECLAVGWLRNSEFFTSAFLGKRERILKGVVRALLAFKGVNVESSTHILLDLECATAVEACNTSGTPEMLIMAKPSNETELTLTAASFDFTSSFIIHPSAFQYVGQRLAAAIC